MKSLVFAGGCFWGVEAYFKKIEGVTYTDVGYANGPTIGPTYEEVCEGVGHTEAVQVTYDSNILSTRRLVNLFFDIIDLHSINKQGNDVGIQYRTGIYYESNAVGSLLEIEIGKLERSLNKPVTVEILPLQNFYLAEEYHQNYLDKNPNGYCHIPKSKLENFIPAE